MEFMCLVLDGVWVVLCYYVAGCCFCVFCLLFVFAVYVWMFVWFVNVVSFNSVGYMQFVCVFADLIITVVCLCLCLLF